MNKKLPRNKCLNCNKECKRVNYIFCNNKCQNDFQYKEYIEKWKNGLVTGNTLAGKSNGFCLSNHVRRYILEKYKSKCSLCGWSEVNPYTNKSPLEFHHKDGDFTNSTEDNLELLCPNCHSLKEYKKRDGILGRRKIGRLA